MSGSFRKMSARAGAAVTLSFAICSASLGAEPVDAPRFDVEVQRVSSGRTYRVGRAELGRSAYVDRKYAFRALPKALVGQILIATSMDDDYVDAEDHLQLLISGAASVYVGIDGRGKSAPGWLKEWSRVSDALSVDEVSYDVFERKFPAGRVTLGGNERRKTGANSNYVVIVVPREPPATFESSEFAAKVRPLLASRCFACHGPELQEGGLRLDLRRRALLGGDGGLAIDPGSSATSAVIARITSTKEKERMPLGDPALSSDEIALLKRWIDAKAPWPDELAGREPAAEHWSFRPLRRPPVPAGKDRQWARSPIDAFLRVRLEQEAISPSPEADRRTLIRRLNFDLLGLPPAIDDVHDFVDDARPDAYERLVDRLLASPRFGERWGKHWLDLARFAESDGYENDNPRPHAWRYRDWVIQAFNADMPFDQFTLQQLAGDLLDKAGPNERIAVAFHRNTLHNSAGGADKEEFRAKAVKDRTTATGAIWMGLTLNCCECHTHKYDPIAHREFYQFYAFFNNADDASDGDMPTLRAAERITRVHKRGNFLDPGLQVEPGVPLFLPPLNPRGSRADRLDLARWLVSSEHPLTARVAVNHVWQHLFGQGLVPTPENFGRKGEPPSHPELLDWLAIEFRGDLTSDQSSPMPARWSRKNLIRRIILSSAYRQSSAHPSAPPASDPDNRLLWRQNRFRLEAEIIRDAALAAGGLLDGAIGGPSVQPPFPKGIGQLNELKGERFVEPHGNPHRRGIYIHMQRTFPHPLLATFDAPDGNQCTMARDRSTTPMQALTLLNEPSLDVAARALGRSIAGATEDEAGRIQQAFERCLARPADDTELEIVRRLAREQRVSGAGDEAVWHGVARAMLNLDEFLTRE